MISKVSPRLKLPEGLVGANDADSAVIEDLRKRVSDLKQFDDETSQMAARIVAWAATHDGKALRIRMLEFKERQAKAPTWEQAVAAAESAEGLQPETRGWSRGKFEAMLDRVAQTWAAEVVNDGCGKPVEIDVAQNIDNLAYWIARTSLPPSRREHFERVRKQALELAVLLEADVASWPAAIELFDEKHHPVLAEPALLSTHRKFVSDRLRGQQIATLLRSLGEQASRQARLDALNPDSKDVPRPNAGDALKRLMVRRTSDWLAERCPSGSNRGLPKLIAGIVNASRSAADRSELVGEDEVKEWLRGSRSRPRKRLRS